MIIFRPHRGGLNDAMKEAKEFSSLKELLHYIVFIHNKTVPFFQINTNDLSIKLYSDKDDRIKWNDVFIICFESYDNINDKIGYHKYFNGKEYNHPCGVLGFFSTEYNLTNK